MEAVQISIDVSDERWRETCKERLKTLKQELQYKTNEEQRPRSKLMAFELYDAVQDGNPYDFLEVLKKVSEEKKLPLSDLFDRFTTSDDSLLHVAAKFGREKIAELIADQFPELLRKKNVKGDTALHIAARHRNCNVIKVILSQPLKSSSDGERLTRMKNEYGNSALHLAVSSGDLDGVITLFNKDKEVAHDLNGYGISPLYWAVQLSNQAIVDDLLRDPFPQGKPYHHGNCPLHAAILSFKNKATMEKIIEKRPELMYLKDENGEIPLHYAASTGYRDGVCILLNKYNLAAAERNINGYLPIHLACEKGHVEIVKEFLKQKWPSAASLLTQNGQNILHVAAKNGKDNVVKYLLGNPDIEDITINERDNDGNTPLHLASKEPYPKVVFSLTRDKRIKVNLINNDGSTARDIVWLYRKIPWTHREVLSLAILHSANSHQQSKSMLVRQKQPSIEWIKDRVSAIMLVAILIATMTFVVGFTVPGSVYSSDEKNPKNMGMAVLAHRKMFQIFVLFNTIAMYSSTVGSFMLLWSQLGDYHLALTAFRWALHFVVMALVTMSVAFMVAVHLIIGNVTWLANVVAIIGIMFISLILVTYILLCLPLGCDGPLLRQVSNVLIWIHIFIYDIYRKEIFEKRESLDSPKGDKDMKGLKKEKQ